MSSQTIGFFNCVCKRAFVPLTDDDQEMPIDNLNALQAMIDALNKRDASDYTREAQLIAEGRQALEEQSADETGPQAEGVISVDDDYDMAGLGDDNYYGCFW